MSSLPVSLAEHELFKGFGLKAGIKYLLRLKEQKVEVSTHYTCNTAVRALKRPVCFTAPKTFKQFTFSLGKSRVGKMFYLIAQLIFPDLQALL